MLRIPSIASWVILIWAWRTDDLSAREAFAFVALWLIAILVSFALGARPQWSVAAIALIDVGLILKVYGGDIAIR